MTLEAAIRASAIMPDVSAAAFVAAVPIESAYAFVTPSPAFVGAPRPVILFPFNSIAEPNSTLIPALSMMRRPDVNVIVLFISTEPVESV